MTDIQRERVENNLKLVDYILQKKLNIDVHSSYYEDCKQEGYVGLVLASLRFNPDMGYEFSTYAGSYILNYVRNYRRNFVYRKLHISRKFMDLIPDIQNLHNKGLSICDIIEELGISIEEYNEAMSYASIGSLDETISVDGDELILSDAVGKEDINIIDVLLEDMIEECILKVAGDIKDDRKRGVWLDYIFPTYYGEKVKRCKLADKYGYSESYINRLISEYREKLVIELNRE